MQQGDSDRSEHIEQSTRWVIEHIYNNDEHIECDEHGNTLSSLSTVSIVSTWWTTHCCTVQGRSQDLGGGGGQEFFLRFGNLPCVLLGGSGACTPEKNF